MCKRRLENERRRADSDECLWKGRRGFGGEGRSNGAETVILPSFTSAVLFQSTTTAVSVLGN